MSENEIQEKVNLRDIRDRFEARGVKSVIFDLDSTLVQTEQYYKDWMIGSAQAYLDSSNIEYSLEDLERIYLYGVLIHRQAGRPLLVYEYVTGGIEKFLVEGQYSNTDYVKDYIEKYLGNFYKHSPKIMSGTLEVLHVLNTLQKPYGIYSHAQYDWTEVKVRTIKEEFSDRYEEEIDIPFFTTPIDQKKDKEGWEKASYSLGFYLSNTLVVGDSINSDIKPAIQAGCRNLVHITASEEPRKEQLVSKIQDISQLFEYL